MGTDAIVFLVDSADRSRFPEAKRELDVRTTRASEREGAHVQLAAMNADDGA